MIRLTASLLLSCISMSACSGWFDETFLDPVDGQFDTSHWLLNKKGFLPVPIIITEPAIGYGAGLALAYFHGNLGGGKDAVKPSVSVVAAGATENGTWFAGGGHLGIWKHDSVRYKGGIGAGLIKMDYYGVSSGLDDKLDIGIEFETEAVFFLQEIQFRLRDSDFFAGASYTFVDTQNTFKLKLDDQPVPGLPGAKFDSRSAALGLMLEYDNRNNILTPSTGTHAQIKSQFFEKALGSDKDYNRHGAYIKHYTQFNDQWMLGLRADAKAIDGDAPFYSYPFIQMRGIKAMRYQGEQTALGEVELSWVFKPRWTLVGFAGAGKAFGSSEAKDSDLIISRGLGMRYLLASKLGLKMGIDIAKGPEDTAFYITAGSAWSY